MTRPHWLRRCGRRGGRRDVGAEKWAGDGRMLTNVHKGTLLMSKGHYKNALVIYDKREQGALGKEEDVEKGKGENGCQGEGFFQEEEEEEEEEHRKTEAIQCLAIQLKHLGDLHPIVAHTVDLMGVALLRVGAAEEALETFEKAAYIYENSGPGHATSPPSPLPLACFSLASSSLSSCSSSSAGLMSPQAKGFTRISRSRYATS
eukprot:276145-Hanusia_phi.AAC.4